MQRTAATLSLLLPLALGAGAARAVIIDSGDGTGNTSAPAPDPGWDNVGSCNGLSCVYLGNGWVLTANHVGAGDATFAGVVYPWVPDTEMRLHNADTSGADLLMFLLTSPRPTLPALAIPSVTPSTNTLLTMIGHGRDRGPATSWNGINGYEWALTVSKRWGTNKVANIANLADFEASLGTQLVGTSFDHTGPSHSTYEAQVAVGDSGGAAFDPSGDLAGILIATATYQDQPPETALFGDLSLAADLAAYRDEIVAVLPEPAGGLWAGAALVAWLARASAGKRREATRAASRRRAK